MPSITTGLTDTTWNAQDNYVERLMDNAAFSAAHPDDTLVLVGPPRIGTSPTAVDNLVPVGMLQNFSINQSRPFQPMMAIGSGRQFFLGGKAQGSAQIGRLFINAQSLMRKLYSNFTDLNPSTFPEQAAASGTQNFVVNLDSEMFLIPFGMGAVIADKSKTVLGAFYLELCVIPTYTIGVAAGQSMILEAVSVLFDRVVPLDFNSQGQSKFNEWNNILSSGMGTDTKYSDELKENTI